MVKIAVAQLNSTIGDFEGNFGKIRTMVAAAKRKRADVVVFPEMALSGYPPNDCVERPEFWQANAQWVDRVAALSRSIPIVMGSLFTATSAGRCPPTSLQHGALFFKQGKPMASQAKTFLPNADVFNETRYFSPARDYTLFPLAPRVKAVVTSCEDMWNVPQVNAAGDRYFPYANELFHQLKRQKPAFWINLNASPFWRGKQAARIARAQEIVAATGLPFIYVNGVGANDEIIFDGRSFALDKAGRCVWEMPAFQEDVGIVDTAVLMKPMCNTRDRHVALRAPRDDMSAGDETEHVAEAIALGIRDYVHKSGFKRVVLGLSGGIDSAVTAALAVRALGREHVLSLWMPSPFSSQESNEDAHAVATALGIDCRTAPIAPLMDEMGALLSPWQNDSPAWALARENVQARLRGTLLMAVANGEGRLLLTTGNKSELAVGYCTLYGDMCGALNPIGDMYKTEIYTLARTLNQSARIFPDRLLTKPPSAELRPNQTDQDSLPPYEILDALILAYMEARKTPAELIAQGFDAAMVTWFIKTFHLQEYKRKQACPILKVRPRSFGIGWRYPIVKKVG